jgi:hypothetical protein
MGADITYQCVSPGVYNLLAKIYRDCRGVPFNNPSFRVFCDDKSLGTYLITNYTRTSINDITPICPGAVNPCSPQNNYSFIGDGIEEHVYEATINFNTGPLKKFKEDGCCRFKIQFSQCCRNTAITTIVAGEFYTDALIDLCNIEKSNNQCNTSPQFSIQPVAFICCNMPFSFNNGFRETTDGDSLSFELVEPLKANNRSENYKGNFYSQSPMTPLCPDFPIVFNCYPNPNANPPKGFYFDKETGDIIFTPIKCDETGVIVIQANEWRINPEWLAKKSDIKWLFIGYTRRDMQLIVRNCANNNPPYFLGDNKFSICEGERICFDIVSKDDPVLPSQSIPNSTTLTWNSGIPDGSFIIKNPSEREKSAEFCWQTNVGDARPNPYTFTATVKDNACPRPAQANRGFNITVFRLADAKLRSGFFCQNAGLINLNKLVVNPILNTNDFVYFKCTEVPLGSGVDKISIITIDSSVSPHEFKLNPGVEGDTQRLGKYKIEFYYSAQNSKCFSSDSIWITIVKKPIVSLDAIPNQCVGSPEIHLDSFALDINNNKRFMDGIWSVVEFRKTRDTSNLEIKEAFEKGVLNNHIFNSGFASPLNNGAGIYLVRFFDNSTGCPVSDSLEILVNETPELKVAIPDTVCSSASPFVLLNEVPSGIQGAWSGKGVSGRMFNPNIGTLDRHYEDSIKLVFKYTSPLTECTDSIIKYITVQSQAEIEIITPKPYQQCEGIPFNIEAAKKWASKTIWSTSGDGTFNDGNILSAIYTHGVNDTAVFGSNGKIQLSIQSAKEGVCPIVKDDIQLIIEPYPQFTMPPHFIQCEPANINFSAKVFKPEKSHNLFYTWDFGNGELLNKSKMSSFNKVYDTAKKGWYDVTLIVHNQWGINENQSCITQKDSMGYVRILPKPKADFSSDPDFFTTVSLPKFKFMNKTQNRWGKDNISYLWRFNSPNNEDTSSFENPLKVYSADTNTYWVNLQAKYTYSVSKDIAINEDVVCEDSIGYLKKIGDLSVFVPSAFSPDDLGPISNNVFRPIVNGEKSYYAVILNRWGEVLWETIDKNVGWDGTYKGSVVDQGVYIWCVSVVGLDGVKYTYEGTLTLLR